MSKFVKRIQVYLIKPLQLIFLSLLHYKTIKVYLCNDFTIGLKTLIAKKTRFPHPVGIVIGHSVVMGNNCAIYQNVTLGTKETRNAHSTAYPKLGDNVTIYPNALVIGDIRIGDNAVIGAGAVVLHDVPANGVAVGNPARVLPPKAPLIKP
ncbi:serine acetyltransferase [Ruficoccus sp. ZRK36]|uniref:serine O-acetyltransferase n=1 Tax=Ruficoccus sp. ZRK36 TaxID=2866311 RepID=UPI001C735707|nr:serine acetyltransferase [Ruficoccus sp. ZRK36]QYY36574.1 serine acetyltransferase [Ruficoccus sp. ZRK36]